MLRGELRNMEKPKPSTGRKRKVQAEPASSPPAPMEISKVPLTAVPVLVTVHLVTADGGEAPEPARAMVSDLLSIHQCEIADGGSSSLSASFSDTVQAVKAIRRIQQLVKGYSRASKKGYLEGCFIVAPAGEANPDLERSLLQRLPTRDGVYNPIFFAGTLYASAKSIPGLSLVPATDAWMAPDSVFQLMPPTHMEGYVEEPLQPPPPVVKPSLPDPVVVPVKWEAPTPGTAMPDKETSDNKKTSDEAAPKPPGPAAIVPPRPPVEKKSLRAAPIEKSPKRAFPLLWVAVGCVSLVVSGVIAYEVSHSHKSPVVEKPIVSAPQSPQSSPAEDPHTIPPSPVPQQQAAPPVVKPAIDLAKKPDRSNKPDKKIEPPPAPKEPGADRTGGVRFTATDVPSLLARATRFSGDGNFVEAIREYNIVLGIEPNNEQAREGLNRARMNQSHR